jgi:hypothetical protein
MEKATISFTSLIILCVSLLCSGCGVVSICRCDYGVKNLPKTLGDIAAHPKAYFNCKQDKLNCSEKLVEMMQQGASQADSKKDFVCAFYKLNKTADPKLAEYIFQAALPDIFFKNPKDSLSCMDLNNNDHLMLASSLQNYTQEDASKRDELLKVIKVLSESDQLDSELKDKLEKLKLAMSISPKE